MELNNTQYLVPGATGYLRMTMRLVHVDGDELWEDTSVSAPNFLSAPYSADRYQSAFTLVVEMCPSAPTPTPTAAPECVIVTGDIGSIGASTGHGGYFQSEFTDTYPPPTPDLSSSSPGGCITADSIEAYKSFYAQDLQCAIDAGVHDLGLYPLDYWVENGYVVSRITFPEGLVPARAWLSLTPGDAVGICGCADLNYCVVDDDGRNLAGDWHDWTCGPTDFTVEAPTTNLALDVAGRCGAACKLRNLVPGAANWLELDDVAANIHNWDAENEACETVPEDCETRLRLTIDGGPPSGINGSKAPVDSALVIAEFCAPTPTPTLGHADCCQCDSSCAAPEGGDCGACVAVRQAECSDVTCVTFTPTPPPPTPTPTPTPVLGSCALSEECPGGVACVADLTEAACVLRAIENECEALSWSPLVTDCSAPAANTGCCLLSATDGPVCAGHAGEGSFMGLTEAGCQTICQTIGDRLSGCAPSVWGYGLPCGDSPYSGCVMVNTPTPPPTP